MKLVHRQAFSSGNVIASSWSRKVPAPVRFTGLQPPLWPLASIPQPQVAANGRRRKPSERIRVLAASASPASGEQPAVVVSLPASQQDAIDAAVQCLLPAMQPLLQTVKQTKTAKGFSNASKPGNTSNRFGVEIPVLDSSPGAVLDLTTSLLAATATRLKQRGGSGAVNWTVVHARDDAVQLALSRGSGGAGGQVLGLRQACQQPQLGGLLVIVEPSVSDVALVEQLLDEVWGGPAAIVLNPGWGQQGAVVPPEYGKLLDTINVVYSFLPCAIQGLLGRKEGAVLRAAEPGSPPGRAAWRILLKQRDDFVQVGAMARRPSSSDLELAFLNAAAASSPLTKTAKFIRGLIPGDKKK